MDNKKFLKLNFHGDPNIGLHGLATEKFCLIGRCASERDLKQIEHTLKVPVIQLGLYGTDFVGLFAVATSDSVLLPDIIYEAELENFKKKLKQIGVAVHVIKTEHTALGNNIILNDKFGIISTVYNKKSVEQIKNAFPKVKFEQFDISDLSIPGSLGTVTAHGGLFSPNVTDADIKKIEALFSFEIGLGTVNLGNPFVSSGVIANSHGVAVGSLSSGYEISRVFESLGFE